MTQSNLTATRLLSLSFSKKNVKNVRERMRKEKKERKGKEQEEREGAIFEIEDKGGPS